MVLNPIDAALFYRLWLPMLDYVNSEYEEPTFWNAI